MNEKNVFTPFKREDHVYHNEAFSELCKDAVRAFNGTPVCELPPPRFVDSGVYAIYCTARKGIYERYGNKVNRMGYNVPIYVGKVVPKSQCLGDCIHGLPMTEQLQFWSANIKQTIGLSLADFRCRWLECGDLDSKLRDGVFNMFAVEYKPPWNWAFESCESFVDIENAWGRLHSIRFRSRTDRGAQDEFERRMNSDLEERRVSNGG